MPRAALDPAAGGGGGGLDGSESDGTNLLSGGVGMTSGWSVSGSTLTNASDTASDGTNTGSFMKEDSGNTRHIVYQQLSPALNTAITRTASVYAKMNGRRYLQMYLVDSTGGNAAVSVYFDLQSGTVTDSDVAITGSSTSISNTQCQTAVNGYFKCSFDFVLGAGSNAPYFQLDLSNVGTYGAPLSFNNPQYTGDNTSGAYLWRPKLV